MPTNFTGDVWAYKEAESTSIDYNNGTISHATMTITTSGSEPFALNYFLTADGGLHWEEVTSGVAHTFTNTGTDLRFKITGSGPVEITHVKIENYH